MTFLRVLPVLACLAVGCGFAVEDIVEVPDNPAYHTDVYPLLVDHCLRCHGEKPNRGAPDYFRLDEYDDVDGKMGARAMGFLMLGMLEADRMPPAARWGDGLGPNGKELLRRWVTQGRPE